MLVLMVVLAVSSIGVGSSIPHSTFDATTYIMGGDKGGGMLLGNGCKPV